MTWGEATILIQNSWSEVPAQASNMSVKKFPCRLEQTNASARGLIRLGSLVLLGKKASPFPSFVVISPVGSDLARSCHLPKIIK